MNNIIHTRNAPSYFWGLGCCSWILKDNNDLSIKLESMPPGAKEVLHFHQRSNQFFFILKGNATFSIDDNLMYLNQHEGLSIAPFQKHFIANESDENIEFLLISNPNTNQDRINV